MRPFRQKGKAKKDLCAPQNLTIRLKLKNEAIAALPPELQEAALELPTELFPPDRQIFTDTPPKPQEEAGKEKMRKGKQVQFGTKHIS